MDWKMHWLHCGVFVLFVYLFINLILYFGGFDDIFLVCLVVVYALLGFSFALQFYCTCISIYFD